MLPGTIGSVVGQVTGALIGALRERRQTVRALAGCARLADLLEAEPDLDALSFYPHLLAWELARLPEGKKASTRSRTSATAPAATWSASSSGQCGSCRTPSG
ncbi:hypothetical protein [Streptomyces cahuitamycinicus]|uniref:hypothetical protein n=1 Tax=Streptomyces cahuitamycinicus TaxID=2070367 RepID=UPI0026A74995